MPGEELVGLDAVGREVEGLLDELARLVLAGGLVRLLDPRLADVSVAAVAVHNGFGDIRGFERAFKATHGTTPGRYRAGHTDGARAE